MRITHGDRTYDLRPDNNCWVISEVRLNKKGAEYLAGPTYPGRFDQALRSLLDRMLRDGMEPDAELRDAAFIITHIYASIGHAFLPPDPQRPSRNR